MKDAIHRGARDKGFTDIIYVSCESSNNQIDPVYPPLPIVQ